MSAKTKKPQVSTEAIQKQLDEALADSFPASDPVSIVTSQTEEDWAEAADRGDENAAGPDKRRNKG